MTPIEKYILDILLNGKNGGTNVRVLIMETFSPIGGGENTDITDELKEIITKSLELKEIENEKED